MERNRWWKLRSQRTIREHYNYILNLIGIDVKAYQNVLEPKRHTYRQDAIAGQNAQQRFVLFLLSSIPFVSFLTGVRQYVQYSTLQYSTLQ